jgi:hypothetical protein
MQLAQPYSDETERLGILTNYGTSEAELRMLGFLIHSPSAPRSPGGDEDRQ